MTESAVRRYLTETLPSMSSGFQCNPIQADYADAITTSLNSPGLIHMIEGDAGIGKSLAYLLSLSDWTARGIADGLERRSIISTFTRSLQRQLLDERVSSIVHDYLYRASLPPVSMGVRMGRRNYVSPARLVTCLGANTLSEVACDTKRPVVEREIASWAIESSGCLLDIAPEALPDGIRVEDIGLSDTEPMPESLERHFASLRDTKILVINHTLLCSDLLQNNSISGSSHGHALLLDEADHFPDAANEALSNRISMRNAFRLARRLRLKKLSSQWQDMLSSFTSPAMAGESRLFDQAERDRMLTVLQKVIKARPHIRAGEEELGLEWKRFLHDTRSICRHLSQTSSPVALSFSPVEGFPSVVAHNSLAGGLINAGRQYRTTILTSATLSDMNHEPGGTPHHEFMRSSIGAVGVNRGVVGVERSFQALSFGQMTLRLPANMPKPLCVTDGKRRELSPDYAQACVPEITLLPGRTLVLCASYRDVEVLIEAADDELRRRMMTHEAGEDINCIAANMAPDGILLTPAGWEGVSPERKGETFWSHVALLRNPTPPINNVEELALQERLKRSPSPGSAARSILVRQGVVRTIHRIRQGVGRGIRHPDDSVTVTILDPRFPRPSGNKTKGAHTFTELVNALPARFRHQHHAASERRAGMPSQEAFFYQQGIADLM